MKTYIIRIKNKWDEVRTVTISALSVIEALAKVQRVRGEIFSEIREVE